MQVRSIILGLVVAMLVLVMAPTSDAQVSLTFYENGSANEITTNRNAATSDITSSGSGLTISGALLANSVLTTTTLTITYSAVVTSNNVGPIPAGDGLRIEDLSGLFALATINTVKFSAGQVLLDLPASNSQASNTNILSGSLRLIGVRVDTTGETAPVTATYSLGSSSNNYLLAETTGNVITALSPVLGAVAVGSRSTVASQGTFSLLTNNTASDSLASFTITEGSVSSWRTATQNTGNASAGTNGTNLTLTFAGVPTGVTLTIATNSDSTTLTTSAPSVTAITSTALVSTLSFSGSTSLTVAEDIQINVTGITLSNTATTLAAGDVTVTVDVAPIGVALLAAGSTPTVTGGYPRYATAASSAVTIGSIIAASTDLLLPYVVSDGLSGGYDTGIAISNTNTDPFTTGGATAAAGTLTFYMYPRTATGAGTLLTLTTATGTTPGVGLATDGTLASGGTWTGLISEVLTADTASTVFTGYVIVRANFLNAHGIAYVTNFATFTSATPALVIPPTSGTARNGPSESLSQ